MHNLIFMALLVSVAPETDARISPGDKAASEYSTSTLELRESVKRINAEPEAGIAQLTAALAAIEQHPELLAHDPPTQELRRNAQLAFARAELALGNHERAAEAIDRVLLDYELAGDLDSLDVAQVGPSLRELVEVRRGGLAMAPRGRLRITCETEIREIVIEGREVELERTTGPGLPLPGGRYSVVVVGASGSVAHAMLLSTEVPVSTLDCGFAPEPTPPPAVDPTPRPPRVAPRGLAAGLAVVGSLGAGAGGLLLGLDGTCRGGGSTSTCPMIYETDHAGAATLAVGAAVLVTGVTLLAIDSARRRKHERARVRLGPGIVQF